MSDSRNTARLKKHLKDLGFKNECYVELLEHIENLRPGLHFFQGNDYINALMLADWGFLQKLVSPIVKQGYFRGNNIKFAAINTEI